ncbi:MAG: TIGR03663 family protein [Gloeobacteraceae cyanobacterium ES-bin-144]|nr:TIGR03663 family protein [Verrucomicrobiales bacterium]
MLSFIVFKHVTKHAVIIFCWISAIIIGGYLRFDDLAKRPFHADEATGARITAQRLDAVGGTFDPKHFHGPLLSDVAMPICAMRGEHRWQELTKFSLRMGPAIAGTLLILVPLLWRRRFGDAPMLLAAACLATSPLLVYYSRMFIHEMLLVLIGMLVLVSFTQRPRWWLSGVLLGLMFATKESFAISVIAWSGAGLLVAFDNRKLIDRILIQEFLRNHIRGIGVLFIAAAFTSGILYTDFFRHPWGAVDAVRTFFVYETVRGHDKSFGYYFELLVMPKKSGGIWWFETPVLILAVIAYVRTFSTAGKHRSLVRFIAYSVAGQFLVYGIISYKTPWLACLPWAHVCLLAGFTVMDLGKCKLGIRIAVSSLVGVLLGSQFLQTKRVIGRFASDERNPYAYVPTRNDVENLESWLEKLRDCVPAGSLEPVAVIGADYWPLPWYLRKFKQIGYWQQAPENVGKLPMVFLMPDAQESVTVDLEKTHVSLPRGLRANVPILLCVRKDIWEKWMEDGTK